MKHDTSDQKDARRILVVAPLMTVGGTERHLLAVLPRVGAAGFAVSLATTRGPGPLDAELRAAGVEVLTPPALLPGRANALLALPWLCGLMLRRRPALVHCFLPEAYLLGGLAACLTGRRQRVMSRRSLNLYQSGRPLSRRLEAWLHRRMSAVVGNSRAVVEQLRGEGVPAQRLHLIRNGIDLTRFLAGGRQDARSALDLDPDALVLVISATLLPYKGHADLLAALAQAKDALPDGWRLLVAGRDEGIGAALRQQAAAAGLGDHIRWLGERDDMPRLLAASDIALLTSHEEGSPNAALEAMAAGLPVIATDVGGCPEAVAEGITGKLVPPRAPDALAAAILDLAQDADLRQRLGAAGRARVEQLYSLEACVAAYAALYDAVLAGRDLPAAAGLDSAGTPAAGSAGGAP